MVDDGVTRVLLAQGREVAHQGLEKALSQWGYEVLIARNAERVLEQLQQPAALQLAIVDWVMPGMDAAEFCRRLRKKKTLNPAYVILLADGRQKADVVTGLEAGADDFLTAPYDERELRARLDVGRRTVRLRNVLVDALRQQQNGETGQPVESAPPSDDGTDRTENGTSANILDEIVFVFKRGEISLPSPPQIGMKFKEMMNSGANLQQIAQVLKQDAAVSSKLISISNSAFYRGVADNKTLEQAVGRLGLATTKQYVEAIANRSLYYTRNNNLKDIIERLWAHSLACAYASQILTQILKFKFTEDPFTLGLLHDIGRLVLLQAVGELQLKKKIGENIEKDELFDTMDKNHNKFGAALLKKWKFSNDYVRIATFHDQIDEADFVSSDLLIVHFANLLVKSMGYNLYADGQAADEVVLEDTRSFRLLKLDSSVVATAKERTKNHLEELKNYFT
ncbi:MAG: HDOD domain-containing protein [Deltaproteobacteria bacterium]|nr:HDOD domain-containing protein [Deltaproteobacteria bacterium]